MGNDGRGACVIRSIQNGDGGNRLLAQAPWNGSGLFCENPLPGWGSVGPLAEPARYCSNSPKNVQLSNSGGWIPNCVKMAMIWARCSVA